MNNKIEDITKISAFRTINISAGDIYFTNVVKHKVVNVENEEDGFNDLFSNLMPLNLDLIYLFETGKLKYRFLEDEYYTYDFIDVSFKYSLKMDENNERLFTEEKAPQTISSSDIRKYLYFHGFDLNKHHYVRYKRSAGSAKNGNCLFVKEELYNALQKWSRTGLDEEKDLCFNDLTSYEAYRALSLSSLISTLKLNPYNILFVKDAKVILKNQKVIKVYEDGDLLDAKEDTCDIENNIFDGEGLLDFSIFEKQGFANKGMMLLRNRFFKCCAFNTNLQEWFAQNHITNVSQLNGVTFAKSINDIKLVVSESCLKYLKMVEGGFNEANIKRWCDNIVDENKESLFGIVKTDKKTRFFDGEMVETTYQLINSLHLTLTRINALVTPYVNYINYIRNIKNTPEFIRYYLEGEDHFDKELSSYEDDSEDSNNEDVAKSLLDYSSYTFKSKVCLELARIDSQIVNTSIFKNRVFKSIIDSLHLKLYNGRLLVHGTYATLFGNPYEYLQYIIKDKNGRAMFDISHPTSVLKEDEIYCPFFKNGAEIVGSRAPHTTMGNVLYSKNKEIRVIKEFFNLSPNIVVVDAINNNIQHRLSGCDYDSDSMLLTDNRVIVEAALEQKDEYLVPYSAFEPRKEKLYDTNKNNLTENLFKIDKAISKNNVGAIVNLSQLLNSHLWDQIKYGVSHYNHELYEKIALLCCLSGAEIDSSKRVFNFSTTKVLASVRQYAKENGYLDRKPIFFINISNSQNRKLKIGEIKQSFTDKKNFKTPMDFLWLAVNEVEYEATRTAPVSLFSLIDRDFETTGFAGDVYRQADRAKEKLIELNNLIKIKFDNPNPKREKKFEIEKKNFKIEIKRCYKVIRNNINNSNKAKLLINKLEKEVTGYSCMFLLLYIIDTFRDELGYSLKDLFPDDVSPLPTLHRTKPNEQHSYVIFNRIYLTVDVIDKLMRAIFS